MGQRSDRPPPLGASWCADCRGRTVTAPRKVWASPSARGCGKDGCPGRQVRGGSCPGPPCPPRLEKVVGQVDELPFAVTGNKGVPSCPLKPLPIESSAGPGPAVEGFWQQTFRLWKLLAWRLHFPWSGRSSLDFRH